MTARINSGQGALGRFLNDEALGRSISGAATNARADHRPAVARRRHGRQAADRSAALRSTEQHGERVDQVVAGLEAGRGTAGQLLHDRQLYENMNRAVLEVRDLLGEIRKDPKQVPACQRQHLLSWPGEVTMSNNESSAGTVLVSFVLGAIAGAAVALLYAPASGEETRRKLAEKAREGRDKAEQLAREGREFIKRQREDLTTADRARPRGLRADPQGVAVTDWAVAWLGVIAVVGRRDGADPDRLDRVQPFASRESSLPPRKTCARNSAHSPTRSTGSPTRSTASRMRRGGPRRSP